MKSAAKFLTVFFKGLHPCTVPRHQKEEFEQSNDTLTLTRIRIFAVILSLLCGTLVMVDLVCWHLFKTDGPWPALLVTHTLLTAINLLALGGHQWLRGRPYRKAQVRWFIHTYISFSVFISMAISLINQMQGGDIFLYIVVLMGFAFVCPFKPHITAIYMGSSAGLFFTVLARLPISSGIKQSITINITLALVISTAISLMLYQNTILDFINRSKLRDSEKNFRKLFLFNPHPLMVVRARDGLLLLANEKARRFYGFSPEQLFTMCAEDIFAQQGEWKEIYQKFVQNGSIHNYITEHISAAGHKKWVMIGLEAMDYNGEKAILCEVTDVTELKRTEKMLAADAYTDPLTGVLNRRRGLELLQQAMDITRVQGGCSTLCFLDLNSLKQVNDRHGHLEGDFFIRTVSGVVEEEIGKEDLLFRYGGDEFILFFQGKTREQARVICKRMKRRLDRLNSQKLCAYEIGVSVGLCSFCGEKDITMQQLIELADREMYKEKQRIRIGKKSTKKTP